MPRHRFRVLSPIGLSIQIVVCGVVSKACITGSRSFGSRAFAFGELKVVSEPTRLLQVLQEGIMSETE